MATSDYATRAYVDLKVEESSADRDALWMKLYGSRDAPSTSIGGDIGNILTMLQKHDRTLWVLSGFKGVLLVIIMSAGAIASLLRALGVVK